MPSRYEPCGLTQMQAQRYGTLPIAHATGGLADTVEDGTTGFLFSDLSSRGLLAACKRACAVFADKAQLAKMRLEAMSRRFDWDSRAAEYAQIYRQLTGKPIAEPAAPVRKRAERLEPVLAAA
jgi:starch synthase